MAQTTRIEKVDNQTGFGGRIIVSEIMTGARLARSRVRRLGEAVHEDCICNTGSVK